MNSISTAVTNKIDDVQTLESLYGEPNPRSLSKVSKTITPLYQRWIEASKFLVIATAGPLGTDASPRGDNGAVVRVIDRETVWLPDWKGNNRLDTLRNIVSDGRASLLFMATGCNNVVRINGTAVLSVDEPILESFRKGQATPKTVIVVSVGEVYFQCAKSLMRSNLWASKSIALPTAGDFLKEADSEFEAAEYDKGYAEYAKPRLW